eukprot:186556_1
MSTTTFFLYYTSFLSMGPFLCLLLCIIQAATQFTGIIYINDKRTRILIYLVYIANMFCGIGGLTLHVKDIHPLWCSIYGLPICFGIYGTGKSLVYLVFFQRAWLANKTTPNKMIKLFLTKIGPIYLIIYWLFYCCVVALFFTAGINPDNSNYSFCIMADYKLWFIILGSVVEMINCFVSLALFLYPLIKSMHQLKTCGTMVAGIDQKSYRKQVDFIALMKWNVCLSTLTVISSAITLFMIPISKHLIWVFCTGDPFLNSLCVYLMMAPNREFMKNVFLCKCNQSNINKQTSMPSKSTKNNSKDQQTETPATLATSNNAEISVPTAINIEIR